MGVPLNGVYTVLKRILLWLLQWFPNPKDVVALLGDQPSEAVTRTPWRQMPHISERLPDESADFGFLPTWDRRRGDRLIVLVRT
jgi:hypothetical protein